MFHRPERRIRKNMEAPKKQKILMAYENKPRCCMQLLDQIVLRWKHLFRNSCCSICAMMFTVIFTALFFAGGRASIKPKEYPEFELHRLKHPLYQTSYLQPEEDIWYADYETGKAQSIEMEGFMQFANYTNTNRKTGRKVIVDGERVDEKVRSYDPATDQFAPTNFIPQECFTNVTYKYGSPLIANIKKDNQLTKDLVSQMKGIKENLRGIKTFMAEMEAFFELANSAFGADKEKEEEAEEEETTGGMMGGGEDNGGFKIPKKLNSMAGGPAPNPHPIDPDKLGHFIFREFDSEEDMFEYVEQRGYGWDEDKPAICFAFQVHENDAKNKYELEMYFHDQWPSWYQTFPRMDSDPAPIGSAPQMMNYAKQAFNGMNLMQVFAANSLLSRKIGPDAEIMMITIPFKTYAFVADSFPMVVAAFKSFFLLIIAIPIIFYTAYALARSKERGFQERLFTDGLGHVTHWFSWFIKFTVLNAIISGLYAIGLKNSIFKNDDLGLIFVLTFLGIESIFTFVWALSKLTSNAKMAIVINSFFIFSTYFLTYALDQTTPPLSYGTKRVAAIFPLTAMKLTIDTYSKFNIMKYALNFENWDSKLGNWSMQDSVYQHAFNFFFYLILNIVIDILTNFDSYFNRCCRKRNVSFENTNKGLIEIKGLKDRNGPSKDQPAYDFTVEKSQICCLLGANSAKKTELLEMLAGKRVSAGKITIKDSDFFARAKWPALSEFLVYRSSDIILDRDLNAKEHLRLFANLRGSQEFSNTTVLCERLLPEKVRVKDYSESQKQCLQTLIALCSENSRIVLLDEPTRGMGANQRSEIIKALWRYKKDRYLIILSNDAELVNVLADKVAKVLDTGIETVNSREIDHKIASYKLIVEVLDGRPSDSLVRYLSKDVPDLTLEYHTDLLTYYILPNISQPVLFQKATFLETNMDMLGLIDYEIVSLPAFEVLQRNIPLPVIPSEMNDGFEDSFDDIDYVVKPAKTIAEDMIGAIEDGMKSFTMRSPTRTDNNRDSLARNSPQQNSPEGCEVASNDDKVVNRGMENLRPPTASAIDVVSSEGDRPVTPLIAAPLCIDEDPEMKEFLDMKETKRPAYRRDFYYDFKRYKTKRTFGPMQCPAICRRNVREHLHNKRRCCALFWLPSLYMILTWHFVRYMKVVESGSLELTPQLLPHKQQILVNEKTQVGGIETKRWIEKFPSYEEAFQPTYLDTSADENNFNFSDKLFEFSTETVLEQPWSQGAYQLYEMDEDRHKYKILSYVNTTAPFSTSLFPQFMIESIMKTAFDDDDFEFKVKAKAMPLTQNLKDKGTFLTFDDVTRTKKQLTMSDVNGKYGRYTWEVVGCVIAAWFMLNTFILLSVMRERLSERKLFLESHGQSKCSYWLARYLHDIVFFIPISVIASSLIGRYETQMDAAPKSVFVQPFAILPFVYIMSFCFKSEMKAALSLLCYTIIFQWVAPYLTIFMRMNAAAEPMGDKLFRFGKMIPLQGSIMSMIFNREQLWALQQFRDVNEEGVGEDIETDEYHPDNAPADVFWMVVHCLLFWFIILVLIEWRLPCCCCYEMRRISSEDNENFFLQSEVFDFDEGGDSSEVAQILGEGQELQLRFHIKQKPYKQLAYLLEDFKLRKPRACLGLGVCCKRDTLISELSAQVQAGSKYAIVADGAHGKTTILNTLTNRKSAYEASGIIRKQIGRRSPIYSSQTFEILLNDLTLSENIQYFVSMGSIHPRLSQQMIAAFGLFNRMNVLVSDLNTAEKHILMLVLALAGSNRTVILDEPFTGLTHDQTIKLVKIIRQKYDCTLIVTAKTKAQLELLQPQSILTIRDQNQPIEELQEPSYLLAVRLRPVKKAGDESGLGDQPDHIQDVDRPDSGTSMNHQSLNSLVGDELQQFIAQNFSVFEKLRGKKRNLVSQVITKLMIRARMSPEVSQEIAEMVHEDIEMQSSSAEMALKCELIMSLYNLIDALCKRFGEVHLELRQDDYAVIRVVFNEHYRMKGIDDSFSDQNPVFSSVVEFINHNPIVKESTSSCHYMSARNAIKPVSGQDGTSYRVKVFNYSMRTRCIERVRTSHQSEFQGSLQNFQWLNQSPSADTRQKSAGRVEQQKQSHDSMRNPMISPFKFDSGGLMTPKSKKSLKKSPGSRRSIIDDS